MFWSCFNTPLWLNNQLIILNYNCIYYELLAFYATVSFPILGVEGLAWINSKYANKSVDRPDLEIMFIPGSAAADSGTLKEAHNLNNVTFNTMFAPLKAKDTFSFLLMVTRPKSRGHVKLRSRKRDVNRIFHYILVLLCFC